MDCVIPRHFHNESVHKLSRPPETFQKSKRCLFVVRRDDDKQQSNKAITNFPIVAEVNGMSPEYLSPPVSHSAGSPNVIRRYFGCHVICCRLFKPVHTDATGFRDSTSISNYKPHNLIIVFNFQNFQTSKTSTSSLMAWKEVWVTAAQDDAAAKGALRLAKSLRRNSTGKKIIVVPGIAVSASMRNSLEEEFDAVFPLDLRNGTEELPRDLEFDEKVKIALHGIRIFQRGVFMSSSVFVLENVDFIFDALFSESPLDKVDGESETKEMNLSCPLFAVIPSKSNFSFLTSHFVSNQSTSLPAFDALQSKATQIFASFGVIISSSATDDIDKWNGDERIRLVMLPKETSGNDDNGFSKWGHLGRAMLAALEEESPQREESPSVPLGRMEEEPIAIVGMACRLPASNNVDEFWNLIINKGDAITKVPEWRWLEEQVEKVTPEMRETKAGFLKCPVDEFDAKFFGMSPKEMEFTDPQQRLLLEVSWEALEDAAIDATSLHGTQMGIFTGTWTRDYVDLMNRTGFSEREFFRLYIGNSYGATAGRMAHFYGTTGSTIATESGCSSSMVAVGLAVKSLRRKETSMALACGVNLMLHPNENGVMTAFCAEDGHCKSFDAAADGFGRAEGCGVLVLKRLSDAVRDGDLVRGVIRGYGEAQEGPSRSLGTPTVEVEALAMRAALREAEVSPREVSVVEAHGTGTAVGDPLEMAAIAAVYSHGRTAPLLVSSVKTNVGHTESASGITGIIKTVLALEHNVLPPLRALTNLNPKIDLSLTPSLIPTSPTPWPRAPHSARLAGVSSFGITGTDAHVILQEAPRLPRRTRALPPPLLHLLALSARSDVALTQLIQKYAEKLRSTDAEWSDVAFTANTGRAHFREFRVAIVAKNVADFQRQVERQTIAQHKCPPISERPKIAFLFTGQGSQYPGMAKELFDTSQDFRRLFNKCDRILRDEYAIDIKRAMWNSEDAALLQKTLYSQTAIFVVDFCLAELWKTWGVAPDVVIGHSLGEYAAAAVAGILRLEDALKLVAERSRLIDNLPRGKMIVVNVDVEATRRLLRNAGGRVRLDVAAMNSPDQTTLAGTEDSVLAFQRFCEKSGVKARVLEASHAFHSEMMDAALPELRKVAQEVEFRRPTCSFVSGMEGREVASVDAEFWVRHTRLPVDFVKASAALKGDNGIVCVEVGPSPILSTFVARNLEGGATSPTLLPSLRRNQSDWRTMTESLGRLYTAGVDVDWRGVHRTAGASKVAGLPTYPFQRKKFWFEKPKSDGLLFSGNQIHPLLHFRVPCATSSKIFQSRLSLEKATFVRDHVVGSHVIFPAAGYVEMILAAGHSAALAEFEEFRFPRQPIFVRDLAVEAPLGMAEKEDVDLQTIVDVANSVEDSNWNCVTIHRRQEDAAGTKSWVRHASAKFSSFCADSPSLASPEFVDVEGLRETLGVGEETEEFYGGLRGVGLNFGESFRSLRRMWRGAESTLAEVVAPPDDAFFAHPVLIDALIQTLMTSTLTSQVNLTQLMVPVKIDHFAWFPTSAPSSTSNSFFVFVDRKSPEASAVLLDAGGRRVAVMSGVTLVPTTLVSIENALQAQKLVLPPFIEEEWLPNNFRLVSENSTIAKGFVDSPAGLRLLKIEIDQTPFTEEEELELFLVNKLAALQGLQAFVELGWTSTVGEVVDVRQFTEKLEIPPKFLLMTRRIFEILSRHTEFVDGSDFTFQVAKPLPSVSKLEQVILELEDFIKHFRVEVECARSVASKTADVLRGRDSVLPILFGEGHIAEKSYTQFKSTAQGNELLVHAIKALCDDVNDRGERQRQLRILEIGGGTGGSTRSILPALEESGVDFAYTFTDISTAFFSPAEASFAQWKERMEFHVLDVEKDPKTQGFLHGDFDVVVAAHVLHATRDFKETMANVRHLLRPNGIALIVETYEPQPIIDMIFGLVDGYWRFEDTDLRPYHCILPETSWPHLLSSSGFASQRLLKIPLANAGVIVAQVAAGNLAYSGPSSQKMASWAVARGSAEDDVTLELTSQLQRHGRRVLLVDDVEWTSELESGRVEGILFISDGRSFDAVEPAKRFLQLIQSLLSSKVAVTPKLVVVTRGAVIVGDQDIAFPHDATLWGMSKSFRNENSNFRVLNVDLDPHDSSHANVASLLRLLWSAKDDFLAVRDQKTFCAKLKWWKVSNNSLTLPQNVQRFGLIFPTTNAISDLQFGAKQPVDVGRNQIEVKVKAAALNFHDLFSVLKPTKEFEKHVAVGADMAGVVTAVGPEVERLKVGDAVIGCCYESGGLPSHIVVAADQVARLPQKLTFEDGSTIPAVFSTAYHCLIDVAQLRKGETVLIHTASGGVGIAAIQVARKVGAKIVATAGSRRKRAYLREVMGIEDVFHSRDLTYREGILGVTGGRGVDVVLNSLTGPGFKEATLDVCAKQGRFIEMSKLNVWSESDVEELRPDVFYRIVDMISESADTWHRLLVSLEEHLETGPFFPISYELFESVDIREALTHLQKARHVGKIVVRMPEDVDVSGGRRHLLFNERSSYLISGGLGGIGLEAAKWMAAEGANFLLLAGRRPPNAHAANVIADLNAQGKVVLAVQLDVGNFDDSRKLIEDINGGKVSLNGSTFPPLRGIQHAAGCLSDGTFPNQTWAKYEETFNAKVRGAWNLHKLTATAAFPLEHFVMYSSTAALLGSMGQSNHVAANAFLDALAHFRNARGLPATSVNWGQWGQVGVAADLQLSLLNPFTPLAAFASLRQILRHHKPQVAVVDADFSKLPIAFPWLSRGYAKSILASSSLSGDKHSVALTSQKFWEEVDAARGDPKETELVLQRLVATVVAQILKTEEGDVVDVDQNLQEMGLDSLMMVELKNILQGGLGSKVTLSASVLADANSIRKLSKKLCQLILEGDELSPEEKVDFILSQTQLEDVIFADTREPIGDLRGENVTVLLSGAVDCQLATSILENLTRRSNVRKVVVLSPEDQREVLQSQLKAEDAELGASKCHVISTEGDSPENLSIPHEVYEQLSTEVDAVVDIRLTSPDESVSGIKREAGMTRQLLEFACHKKLKFVCHVNRLLPQRKATEQRVLEETFPCGRSQDLAPYTDSGYSSSQFVSEVLLGEAARRGVPCSVFRVPHLSGHSHTGRFQLEEGHIFTRYLEFLRVGAIPKVPVPFALVPVDQAAGLLLQVLWSTSTKEDSPSVFNLSNPHEYSMSDFVEVSAELGRPVRAVELEEFLAENKNSLTETMTFVFGDPLDFSGNSSYSQLAKAAGEEQIPMGNLRRVVVDLEGQVETPLGILRRDLTFAHNSGLFHKFLLHAEHSA